MPFVLAHVAVLGAFWSGVTVEALVCAALLFVVRMFGITAGYHRYFAHRTFRTSRLGQLALAFLAQTSSQRGVLWWAAHHRRHHRYSDQPDDVHSPRQRGFWYAHVGWIFDSANDATDSARIADFEKFPELRWLDRWWFVPPVLLGFGVWLGLGWSGLFVGFFLSTVVLWHATFAINSLAHVFGSRRFETTDDSRNSWWLALLTLGEGWHNNHHRYMTSTRQGFYWWEVDLTYYALRVMSWFGLVWALREPPPRVLREGRHAARA